LLEKKISTTKCSDLSYKWSVLRSGIRDGLMFDISTEINLQMTVF